MSSVHAASFSKQDAESGAPGDLRTAPSPSSADLANATADELKLHLSEERRLRNSAEQALALRDSALDAANTHFMVLDVRQPGWPMVYVNRAMAHDHGYAPEDLIGCSALTLAPPELNSAQIERLNNAILSKASIRGELHSRRKDGRTLSVGISLRPISDRTGAVTHYVGVGADITQRRAEAEEKRRLQARLVSEMQERERMAIELRLAQKLESVGRLAAGIAHEINTPTQYIGDGLEFVRTGLATLQNLLTEHQIACRSLSAGAPAEDVLQQLRQAAEDAEWTFLSKEMPRAIERSLEGIARIGDIVRAMKEFAHPGESEHSYTNLNHAIQTTLLVSRSEYRYIATVQSSLGEIPEVLCNVGELNQVLLNLIVNAAHAIDAAGKDSGSGLISISTSRVGEYVEIVVADNGCGIAPENLERIFDPFFTTKEVGKGTGQGLAIARSIVVDKHGGSIEVQSEPGAGARFVLRLPIAGRSGTFVT